MKNFSNILEEMGIPITDARESLARNDANREYGFRVPSGIAGLVAHQVQAPGSIEAVARYHVGRGKPSIAYTWAIRNSGEILLCNDLGVKTWSHGDASRPGDENREFMAVLLEGEFIHPEWNRGGHPTSEQLVALGELYFECKKIWGWSPGALYGHYHFGKSFCPGSMVQGFIEGIRAAGL